MPWVSHQSASWWSKQGITVTKLTAALGSPWLTKQVLATVMRWRGSASEEDAVWFQFEKKAKNVAASSVRLQLQVLYLNISSACGVCPDKKNVSSLVLLRERELF